ncbi:MAG: Hpt domain-containing protein [Betaproteobacteria bacterium]|nr:Hpt domain-containing protein [Betaproteobacteria bacterium]
MANLSALIEPKGTDRYMLEEFLADVTERAPEVERDVSKLVGNPSDRAIMADLFRAVHNIKGNASLTRVPVGVAIAHPIENLLTRLRAGELRFSEVLGEAVLLAIDRLELAAEAMVRSRPLAPLRLVVLVEGLEELADAAAATIDDRAAKFIEDVTGYRPVSRQLVARAPASAIARAGRAVADDLRFFRSIAQQLESRSPLYKGRSSRLLRLAQETNEIAGKTVDPAQLEAAVYMHDLGMMFLPDAMWLKSWQLHAEDRKLLHLHPVFAAGLLQRMDGWAGAAAMVAQHHEMPDGKGYPEGLMESAIGDGAKILAIVDAFEAVTLKHRNRGHRVSTLRAIAEVNACDNQFAAEWVAHFNSVIRRLMEE